MDTIFVTEKLILHAEKEQLLGISFWDKIGSDSSKLHTKALSEPVSIKDLKGAIDLYLEDDEKASEGIRTFIPPSLCEEEIREKHRKLARDWVM